MRLRSWSTAEQSVPEIASDDSYRRLARGERTRSEGPMDHSPATPFAGCFNRARRRWHDRQRASDGHKELGSSLKREGGGKAPESSTTRALHQGRRCAHRQPLPAGPPGAEPHPVAARMEPCGCDGELARVGEGGFDDGAAALPADVGLGFGVPLGSRTKEMAPAPLSIWSAQAGRPRVVGQPSTHAPLRTCRSRNGSGTRPGR